MGVPSWRSCRTAAQHASMPSSKTDSSTPSSEFLTLYMKPGETELLRLRNSTNAISALAELIWNALDADAKLVEVDWTENELMGVETIVVSDDGHGIAFDEKRPEAHPFMTLGDSAKHTVDHHSPTGRILHGRFGKGRLRALALGGVITWDTTFAKGKTNKSYLIKATVGESSVEVSRPKTSKRSPGTTATVSLVSEKGNTLDPMDVRQRFAQIFSEHLTNYPDIKIRVRGERLDPNALIRAQHELGDYDTSFTDGDELRWSLRATQWTDRVSDAKGRLFLCDEQRVVIAEYELGVRGAEDYTFYLDCSRTREWEDDGLIAMREDAQEVLNEARRTATKFLRRSFKQRAQSLTEELIDQRIYPYSSAANSPADEAEKKLFAQFALHIRQSVGSYDKMNLDNKRLLFKLLQELLHREPMAVAEVLSNVLKLSHEDRKALEAVKKSLLQPV
jgi:hypothetical protein